MAPASDGHLFPIVGEFSAMIFNNYILCVLLPMILKFGFKVVSHALFMCALWFYGCLMASTSPLSTGILVVHLICLLTRLFKFFYLTFKLFILQFLIGFFNIFFFLLKYYIGFIILSMY